MDSSVQLDRCCTNYQVHSLVQIARSCVNQCALTVNALFKKNLGFENLVTAYFICERVDGTQNIVRNRHDKRQISFFDLKEHSIEFLGFTQNVLLFNLMKCCLRFWIALGRFSLVYVYFDSFSCGTNPLAGRRFFVSF